MENQTHFDLNAAIENWRNELAAQPNLAPGARRELETHLRDAIAGFQQRGLNDEESFWLAGRRIGRPRQLDEEFLKADAAKVWRERVFWMAAGSLFVNFWIKLVGYIPMHNWQNHPLFAYIYFLIYYLPLVLFAILLAKFGANKIFSFFTRGFPSRLWFAVFSMSVVIFICITQTFIEYEQLVPSYSSGVNLMDFICLRLFSDLIWPLALVALLVWLMPMPNRKTPKHA
jgi:hypothetical protein